MFGERQRRFLLWGLCFLFTIVQCGYAALIGAIGTIRAQTHDARSAHKMRFPG